MDEKRESAYPYGSSWMQAIDFKKITARSGWQGTGEIYTCYGDASKAWA
jgi:hypothetical protein